MLVSGDEGIVYRYSVDRQLLDRFTTRLNDDTSSYQIRSLLEDQRGRIWVGSIGGGLQTFNAAGERLAAYTHESSDPNSLSTDTVFSLLMDSAGVLWAGSLSAGLSKVSIAGARFVNYWHRPENPLSLSHDMVNEFAEDGSGSLWVGTSGGGVDPEVA